jgi:hypothetical protein
MFQKYTESARRVIFFARYEASSLGGSSINTEHLLLGLLREQPSAVVPFLDAGRSMEALRHEIREVVSEAGPRLSTSVEMPLGDDAKLALTHANEESEHLSHSEINEYHMLLGLLHAEESTAARVLKEFGVDASGVRLKLMRGGGSLGDQPRGIVVSKFYGIEISLDLSKETQPAFTASYGSSWARYTVDPVRLTHGSLPQRAASMVVEWAGHHQGNLRTAWETAKAGELPSFIPPLE